MIIIMTTKTIIKFEITVFRMENIRALHKKSMAKK